MKENTKGEKNGTYKLIILYMKTVAGQLVDKANKQKII